MPARLTCIATLSAFAVACALGAGPATAEDDPCGGRDAPCAVPLGAYVIALPEGAADGPRPVLVHLHGAGGSGRGALGVTGMVAPALARGYLVIAPDGLGREDRSGGFWSFGLRPDRRDERAFLQEVLDDAARRFGADRSRVLLSGFSIGGSMVWRLACEAPEDFAAFAPVAGGFWRPFPEDCAGPVKLLHTHGWRDGTVPLEGRPLRGGAAYQGDVFEAMQRWRLENGCAGLKATAFDTDGPFWRRSWTDCAPGTALEFALHPGGHTVPDGWAEMALDWFEAVTAPPPPE